MIKTIEEIERLKATVNSLIVVLNKKEILTDKEVRV